MEMINIMDNKEIKYGITELPPISKTIKHVEKYWGWMTTLFETDDYSIKKIFMKNFCSKFWSFGPNFPWSGYP